MADQGFNLNIPIVKAGKAKNGQWWVHGVASDESLDLQGEVTLPSGIKPSLPYLRKWGKFNDNHGPVSVGDIVQAEVVTKGELADRGIIDGSGLSEMARKQEALYVAGPLFRHVPEARYYRNVLRSGGRLGLSIQGRAKKETWKSQAGKPVTVNTTTFVNKVALTDEPVNPNTWAALAKSFGSSSVAKNLMRAIAKALTTGHGIVAEGDTGGATLRKQSLEGARKRRRRRRSKEAKGMEHEFTCMVSNVEKSLGGLSADDVRQRIQEALRPAAGNEAVPVAESGGWVNTIYDDHAIVSKGGKYFSYPFKVSGGKVTLGEPVEVVQDWKPVADASEVKKAFVGEEDLDDPVKIAKAWAQVTNPEAIAEVDPDAVGEAMHAIRKAALSHGLGASLAASRGGVAVETDVIVKSLSETDMRTLATLEAYSDEDFATLVAADIEALKKSRASEKPEAPEAAPAKGGKADGPIPPGDDNGGDEDEKDLDEMSLDELKAYAKKNGIDLSDLDEDEMGDEDAVRDAIEDAEEGGDEEGSGEYGDDEGESEARKSLADLVEDLDLEEGEVVDIAPILRAQSQEVAKSIEGVHASIESLPESIAEGVVGGIAKALEPIAKGLEALTGLAEKIEAIEKSQAEITGAVDEISKTPMRAGQYRVIEKGGGGDGLSRAESFTVLQKAVSEGMIDASVVTEAELGGVNPNVVKSLKDQLVAGGKLSA